MEADAKYTLVGATVLLLVALVVLGVVWIKGTADRNDQHYTIHFEEQALDGLQVGSSVDMRGIRVGRVEDYALDAQRLNRVRVHVRIDERVPVRENTVAVITRNLVTGIAEINLVTQEPAGPPLTKVPPNERYPVIAEGRSDLKEIAGRVSELGDTAVEVLNNINRIFTSENRKAIAQTLQNTQELTASLKTQSKALETTFAELNTTLRDVRGASTRIAATTETLGQDASAALKNAGSLITDMRGVVADVQRTVQQSAKTLETLQQQTATLGKRVDSTASSIDSQLYSIAAELRTSLGAINRSLDRLSDPRSALLGPDKQRLGPGERMP